ncbi:cell envelope biogenesis protein TolA [Starkeya koreensis]|uniref:Cell envelope biogenesis protein TolA n=1 Tax=Ancylobacter koreensis TaxID=266121 RepID=A0ABT0DLG9_9HYPH|nr:cell envelope biogenesis protein TolA [Ancylobacter koreensis]MCK0208128.1 cell envelope biogenesis protein TolA [Ancylobacter koreensis]
MRAGLASSFALHAGIIGFMVVSFSAPNAFETTPTEAMPIDIISDAEMTQMMAGKKDAPKENPKPVAEKKGETPKPPENLDAKVDDKKPEIEAAKEAAAPPPPPAPEKPAEPKPPAQQAEAKPPEPPKDAEALAAKPPEPKQEPKPEQQQAQTPPPPAPPKKPKDIPPKVANQPPKDQPFNPNQIAALLNKQDARRQSSIGDTINNTASLGASSGMAATLSQTELDALRAYLARFWHLPTGAADITRVKIMVVVRLSPNRTLVSPPEVVGVVDQGNPYAPQIKESVVRAIFAAAQQPNPFPMLSAGKYDVWQEMQLTFDPSWIE